MDLELLEECLDCREVEGIGLQEIDWRDEEPLANTLRFGQEKGNVAFDQIVNSKRIIQR